MVSPLLATVASYSLGRLSRPRLDRADLQSSARGTVQGGLEAQLRDREGDRPRGVACGQLGPDAPVPVGVAPIAIGTVQPDVVDRPDRPGQQRDVAEDAGQPPLVLVLDKAHRRPLRDPDREHVPPRHERRGDVELLDQPAALADPDLGAVEPDSVHRLDPVETEQHPLGVPARVLERGAVVGGRVLVRNVRHIDRERELDVGVDRLSVRPLIARGGAVVEGRQHPVGRDGHPRPAGRIRVVVVGVRERGVQTVVARVQPEAPVAVQAERRSVGVDPGPGRGTAAAAGCEVLDIARHDQHAIGRAPRVRQPFVRTGRITCPSGNLRTSYEEDLETTSVSGGREGKVCGFGHQEASQADGEEEASQAAEAHTHPAPSRRQVGRAHLGQPNSAPRRS